MTGNRFHLTPLDTYLFRDGRPFEMRRARPLSPLPPPSTLYGALRHMLLEYHGISYVSYKARTVPDGLYEILGPRDGVGELAIVGPFFRDLEHTYLPWPADLVFSEDDCLYQHPGTVTGEAKYPDGLAPFALFKPGAAAPYTKSVKRHENADWIKAAQWWQSANLSAYLLGNDFSPQPAEPLYSLEPHTGITRSAATRTAVDGQLFTVDFTRLADNVSFEFEIENGAVQFPEIWNTSVGGERRPVLLKAMEGTEHTTLRDSIRSSIAALTRNGSVSFRLFLVTPARFVRTWKPECFIEGDTFQDNDVEYTLRAAAMAKGPAFSGWDLALQEPRSSIRTVPAGSVYFLTAKSDLDADTLADRIFKRFWFQPGLLAENNHDRKMGFARTLIGVWNNERSS